jgi:hypothetical protein
VTALVQRMVKAGKYSKARSSIVTAFLQRIV